MERMTIRRRWLRAPRVFTVELTLPNGKLISLMLGVAWTYSQAQRFRVIYNDYRWQPWYVEPKRYRETQLKVERYPECS